MQMTTEARAWLDDLVRRVLARHPLRDPERAGVTYELMSHVHAAAERKATEAGRDRIDVDDLRLAVVEMGGEDELARAFVQPLAAPPQRAGFWIRVGAWLIDVVILWLAGAVIWSMLLIFLAPLLRYMGMPAHQMDPFDWSPFGPFETFDSFEQFAPFFAFAGLMATISGALTVGYFTYFEGKEGRSLGKRALGLRVVRLDGAPMTYREGLIRNLAKLHGGVLLLDTVVGWLAFRDQRQRASDRIAETVVIRA